MMQLTDELLIEAIREAQPDAYGNTIMDALRKRGVACSYASIYLKLDKMERKGVVQTHREPGGPERGGHDKLMVVLTENNAGRDQTR